MSRLGRLTMQGLRLTGTRPAVPANRERGKQRCTADSQASRPELFQAEPTLVVRF
jgi:hypothetical protein